MKFNILITSLAILGTGCSTKISDPVQLEDTTPYTINQELIKKRTSMVPQDHYLKKREWRATIQVYKGRYYLPNEKLIKTFYYAHHAHRITIKGDKHLIARYKRYFKNNGVNARICLTPIQYKRRDKVNIVFSHLNYDKDISCRVSGSKNMQRADVPVIQI